MADKKLLACPPQLKAIQHYLKLAIDYEQRQPIIAYWARLYALQTAIKIDKKSPEARTLLGNLMECLETFKKSNADNETLTSDVAGQALMENEANRLFVYADSNDRAAVFNKNIVKSFYSAGVILDICEVFGELSEEVAAQRKYAKWKATYIHNCLKNGETPMPGPIGEEHDDEFSINIPAPPPGGDGSSTSYHAPDPAIPLLPNLPPVEASSPAHYSQPSVPVPSSSASPYPVPLPSGPPAGSVVPANLKQARKHCKWADSALDYEDISTAVENLNKALALLTQR